MALPLNIDFWKSKDDNNISEKDLREIRKTASLTIHDRVQELTNVEDAQPRC